MQRRILLDNFPEMAPIVYTPTVGWACLNYHLLFRRPRGMYFSAADKGEMVRSRQQLSDLVTASTRCHGEGGRVARLLLLLHFSAGFEKQRLGRCMKKRKTPLGFSGTEHVLVCRLLWCGTGQATRLTQLWSQTARGFWAWAIWVSMALASQSESSICMWQVRSRHGEACSLDMPERDFASHSQVTMCMLLSVVQPCSRGLQPRARAAHCAGRGHQQ